MGGDYYIHYDTKEMDVAYKNPKHHIEIIDGVYFNVETMVIKGVKEGWFSIESLRKIQNK